MVKRKIVASSESEDEASDDEQLVFGLRNKRKQRFVDSDSDEAPARGSDDDAVDALSPNVAAGLEQQQFAAESSVVHPAPGDESGISLEAMGPLDGGGVAGRPPRRGTPDVVGRTIRGAKEFLKAHRGDRMMDLRAARLSVLPKDVLACFVEQNKARARGAWVWTLLDELPNDAGTSSSATHSEARGSADAAADGERPVMFDQLDLFPTSKPTFSDFSRRVAQRSASLCEDRHEEVSDSALIVQERPAGEPHARSRPRFRPQRPVTDDNSSTAAMTPAPLERPAAPFVIPAALPCRHPRRRKPDVLSRFHWTCEDCGHVLMYDGWSAQYQAQSNFATGRNGIGELQGGFS